MAERYHCNPLSLRDQAVDHLLLTPKLCSGERDGCSRVVRCEDSRMVERAPCVVNHKAASVVERDVTGREDSGSGRVAVCYPLSLPNPRNIDLQAEADKYMKGASDVAVCEVFLVENRDAVVVRLQTTAAGRWNVRSSSFSGMCLSSLSLS